MLKRGQLLTIVTRKGRPRFAWPPVRQFRALGWNCYYSDKEGRQGRPGRAPRGSGRPLPALLFISVVPTYASLRLSLPVCAELVLHGRGFPIRLDGANC